jgi:YVTN family beta-propeller protein
VPGAANPPAVGLIVKKNAAGQWMDDNNHNWTHLVSGPNAALSGRPVGWDILDNDLAVISASSLGVTYATGLMNIGMSVGINPATGAITVVGTEATNEVRFEPVVKAKFTRVELATVNPANLGNKTIVDLNPHLDYAPTAPTAIAQTERNRSIGDPRAIVWNAAGTKGYVAGMGSNNVTVINPAGARAGLAQNIDVGEGPTGIALDEARGQFYVLNRFVINTSNEVESHRISFFDPSPTAIKVGRKHLYDTHKNSGLGQIACASCHVDGKMDRLAWDLGDPTGAVAPLAPNNLGANIPGLNTGFAPFHPMTTQTLQDIIGHEPHHWRGDRTGIEAFAGAFIGLQGDDTTLTTTEMQQFEDFLATIYFPPNPFRNFDNTLPTNLPLPGHYTTGRFGPAGQPLPNGNAVSGLAVYRDVNRRVDRNALACVTCHTLPTDRRRSHGRAPSRPRLR